MKVLGVEVDVLTKEEMVKNIFTKYQAIQVEKNKENKRFPLSPSGALKEEIDLYYELCAYFDGETHETLPMSGETHHLLGLGHYLEPLILDLVNLELEVVERNKRITYGKIKKKDDTYLDLSGETDAIAKNSYGELFIIDSKTSGRWAFDKKEVKEDYVAQLNLYMHGTGIKKALICYYCKDNSNMRIHEFNYNKELAEATLDKFQRMLTAYENKTPPKMTAFWGGESWRPSYSKYREFLHKDFELSLGDREVVEVDSLLKEITLFKQNGKKAIDFIAQKYHNKLVIDKKGNQLFLSLTKKGLVLKLKDKEGMISL